METWMLYAILAMLFAGVTSVLAKSGLENVHADFGLGVRTTTIFLLITILNVVGSRYKEWSALTSRQLWLLVASGCTTTLSWVFYYRAMKAGPVSVVATIDKASIVVTLLLAFWLLKEPVTPRILAGGALILAGLLVLVWK